MRFLGLVFLAMVVVFPAAAQEANSPSSLALQINTAIAALAQRAEFAERQVVQLNLRVKELQKQIDDAKPKQPSASDERR